MADPSSLYQALPDCFDRDAASDQYKLLAGLAKGTEDAKSALADFRADLALATADGVGLDRLGENFSLARPPGLLDVHYRAVISIIAGGRRGTVAIIKAVLEASTGVAWVVVDRQLDVDKYGGLVGIPAFEVWAKTDLAGIAYGRAYAEFDTHIDGHPVESGIGGPVIASTGKDGGMFNDHAGGWLDLWTMALVSKVRPAGVFVVYKDFTLPP